MEQFGYFPKKDLNKYTNPREDFSNMCLFENLRFWVWG